MLFTGGTVVTAQAAAPAAVRVVDGVVSEVGDLTALPGEEVVDCHGCLVLPGGIDTHTHLQLESMGTVTADDFGSGTRSALAGGTTTVLDFATQFHGESLAQGLAHWHTKAAGNAVCDYGFHLAMTQWRPEFADEMADMAAAGVTSFKMYLAYRNTMMVEDDEVYAALSAAADLGCTIGFHCENGRIIDVLAAQQLAAGHTGAYWHQHTRPPELEAEALTRLGMIAGLSEAPHYVVHLSAGLSIPVLRAARAAGSLVIAETCPQYLVLDGSAYGEPDTDRDGELEARKYVMSPPLRTPADSDLLWKALADGDIQFVGTDHCSFRIAGQKDAAVDFREVPNGAPGLELRLPLLYSYGVGGGRISLERFVAVVAENPARYFGLYPRKGVIAPGSDADIVVFDPSATWTIRHDLLHDGCDYSPYEGRELTGRVRDVFLRGRRVVRDGEPLKDLPPGGFIRRGLPDNEIR